MSIASVAQSFRALPCQGRGRELESLRSHHRFDINLNPSWGLFYLNKPSQHLDFANSNSALLVYY